MGILSIYPVNPDSPPELEKTGKEPRGPHLQKNTPMPVPSPTGICRQQGCLKEGEAVGLPCHVTGPRPWRQSPHKYIQLFRFKPTQKTVNSHCF